MPDPAYAVVEIVCDPAKLGQLHAVPNLEIDTRPIRTADPGIVRVGARADAAAQAAAQALGCTVTIVKTAEAYLAELEENYGELGTNGGD